MNTVTRKVSVVARQLKVSDLGRGYKHTAFIGQCGSGPINSLYLITYDCVVLALEPRKTWGNLADVTVDRFCDVEIIEK